MPPAAPTRWLYLHGFASSPASSKAVAVAEHFAQRGIDVDRLDLRVPSFEHLRLSAMIAAVRAAIGAPDARTVVFGSSMGGLTACRAAEQDPRIAALVLMAPAFRMMERWRMKMNAAAWEEWRTTGWTEVDDYAERRKARLDFGFTEDALQADAPGDGWPDVRVPTLIVHGTQDDIVDVELSRQWARGKDHVRLVEVPDGHELRTSVGVILRESEAFLEKLGFLAAT